MLVYDDTSTREAGAAPAQATRPAAGVSGTSGSLGSLVALLRRRAVWIVGCALVGALVAFLAGKALTPRYTAEAQLYIDPRDMRLVDKELTPGGQDASGFMPIVESQAQVITSSAVLKRVVDTLDLPADAEFGGETTSGLLSGLAAGLGFGETNGRAAPSREDAALETLEKRVSVRRTGRTFIVDVIVWTREAEKSARIANAVVASYLAEDAAQRAEAANRASSGLSARLVELREAVNQAESRVQAYKAEKGLVGVRDTLVTDQQLTQLNGQLATARVRAADALSRVEQLERMQKLGSDIGGTEDALASQAIASMRAQYAELSRKQAELMHDLGPRHPLVTSIASQVAQSRRLIDQEIARYTQAAKSDLARAQATVTALERSFDAAKTKTVGQAEASIRLRELEREVEARRAVYQAFMVRSQETGQQARLDVSNARIITPALKPINRSYPPPARILALIGLVAGLLFGIGLALADDRLRRDLPAAPVAVPAPAPAAASASVRASGLPEAIEVVRRGRGSAAGFGRASTALGGAR